MIVNEMEDFNPQQREQINSPILQNTSNLMDNEQDLEQNLIQNNQNSQNSNNQQEKQIYEEITRMMEKAIEKNEEYIWVIAEKIEQVLYLEENVNSDQFNVQFEQNYLDSIGVYDSRRNHDPNCSELLKKIQIIAINIKYTIKQMFLKINILSYFNFFTFQSLIVWACILLGLNLTMDQFVGSQPVEECQQLPVMFFSFIIATALFQYYEVYGITILAIIVSPFALVIKITQNIKNCINKRKQKKFLDNLKKIKYKPGVVEGQTECSICMGEYEINEQIVILSCNKFHHFHSDCVKTWLKVTSNCPLCRKQFQQ